MSVLVTMRVKVNDFEGVKGEDFNALIQPAGDWDDVVWRLSDAVEVK